jgi:hypothetical protein
MPYSNVSLQIECWETIPSSCVGSCSNCERTCTCCSPPRSPRTKYGCWSTLRGPKYPLAFGSGIVAMIKPTSAGLDRSSVRTSPSGAESSTPFLSCSCGQNGRALCAFLFALGKCSRYSFSHSVSFMACRFFSTFYNLFTHLVLYAMNSSSAFNSLYSAR